MINITDYFINPGVQLSSPKGIGPIGLTDNSAYLALLDYSTESLIAASLAERHGWTETEGTPR